ncbi:MAG: amino acid permease [Peptostreptococcaceae bacterium]|nr:amino acid permease [Peptostreptococcaceae bacterium]
MENNQRKLGLITAINMVVGVLIGSGIFFKADDILRSAQGNIFNSLIVFLIGAFCVIFSALSISYIARHTKSDNGVIDYYDRFLSKDMGGAMSYFYFYVYFPTVTAVIAWVCGVFLVALLGIPSSFELEMLVGLCTLILLFLVNSKSILVGGFIQNVTTFIKLIPLVVIPLSALKIGSSAIVSMSQTETASTGQFAFLAALAPIAFSFDGWIIATTITGKIKNPNRNIPLALTIGPLFVLLVYVLYFLGMIKLVGPEAILTSSDGGAGLAGQAIWGNAGEFILQVFIFISVLGVLNGLVLGYTQLPAALNERKLLPFADKFSKRPSLIVFIISIFWMAIHYITHHYGLLGNSDISEISIVFGYTAYILLHLKSISLRSKKEITSNFYGYIFPTLAILGSVIILIGGILSNPVYVPIFIAFCAAVSYAGYAKSKSLI